MNGYALLQCIKSIPEGKKTDVVLMTGYSSVESAVQSLRAGAYDYLLKPVNLEELASVIDRIAEHQSLIRENYELTNLFDKKLAESTRETISRYEQLQKAYSEVIGIGTIGVFSQQMRDVVATAQRFHANRSVPVLIGGETGTGKEIIARLVHYGQNGDDTTPFIPINCSAIQPNLFESELFGYEDGAFSGAAKGGQKGKFEMAQGGSLFLDEIGDVPLAMQPKLLRVLQERELYRIGGVKKINLDTRIICATNHDLAAEVGQGNFRKDLFYRLNTGSIFIPPLRERKEDIQPLAQMFLKRIVSQKGQRLRRFSDDAVNLIEEYHWPGNVRELQSEIERIVILYDDNEIRPEHFGFLSGKHQEMQMVANPEFDAQWFAISLPPDGLELKTIEARIIAKVLDLFNGNKTRAAAYLGIARNSLRKKID
jgi:DNA-binding NtrC family response regulator